MLLSYIYFGSILVICKKESTLPLHCIVLVILATAKFSLQLINFSLATCNFQIVIGNLLVAMLTTTTTAFITAAVFLHKCKESRVRNFDRIA